MRGSIRRAQRKTRHGLKPGEHAWDIIVPLGKRPDKNGTLVHRQRWTRFIGTRKQAEAKLNELVGHAHKGQFVEPSKVTVREWLDQWLDMAIKPPRCTLNTYRLYRTQIKKHIAPELGHIPLQLLTTFQLEQYYAGLKLAAGSVAIHHAILSSALKAATKAKLLHREQTIARDVTNKPRVNHHEDVLQNVWTADEARRFLTWVKHHESKQYVALFALALDAGLRISELLALRWKDLVGSLLRVERQLLFLDKRDIETLNRDPDAWRFDMPLPKGKRARTVDVSDDTVALLRDHKREQSELKLKNRPYYADHDLIFARQFEDRRVASQSVLGRPLSPRMVVVHFDKACKGAMVKRITLHGLRHTCATLSLGAGVPVHVVQQRLGHASSTITLDVYSHVLPSQQADAASKLAAVYWGRLR